jgi:hypothetical protein
MDIGIAVPRARSAEYRSQPYGPPGSVNARPRAHGALVPPNISAQNQTNQNGPIPNCYGTYQYFPPYAGLPYIEPIPGTQNSMYRRALYLIGYGPVDLSEFFLGNDSINPVGLTGSTVGYDKRWDTFVEVRYGLPGDTPMTLYPSVAEEDDNAVTLSPGWAYKETPIACDEILLFFAAPNGLYQDVTTTTTDSSGKQVSTTTRTSKGVDITVEYASCDSHGNLTSGYTSINFSIEGQSGAAITTSRRILVSRGLYIVRAERSNSQSTDNNTHDQVNWNALTALVNEDPIPPLYNWDGSVIPLAKVAIRVGNNRAPQALNNFSCLVKRHLPVWNGTSFTTQQTNNPAWALLDIYTGQLNKKPVSTSRFDLAGLLSWANSCDNLGLQYNDVLDTQQTAYQAGQAIATAGRASFLQKNGLYGVFHDIPNATIAQHFTPRNSSNFKLTKVYPRLPNSLLVDFVNPDVDYQQDSVIVYADGYSADGANGTQIAYSYQKLQLPGVTNATQAQKLGRYYLAVGALRPRTLTFNVDFEHLLCNVGDRIEITHDVLLQGIGQGYITAVNVDGSGNVLSVAIDETITMDGQSAYSVSIRMSDNSTLLEAVNNTGNATNLITFTTPIPHTTNPLPAVGNLLTIGNGPTADFLVTKIEPQTSPHMSAIITAVDYSPAVFTADTEEYGTFVSSIQLPVGLVGVDVPPPTVVAVQSDVQSVGIALPGGATQTQVVITFQPGNDSRVTTIEGQWLLTGSGANWSQMAPATVQSGQITFGPVQQGLSYDFQIRSVTAEGLTSDWETVSGYVAGTDTNLPPDITSANVSDGLLTWVAPALPSDFAGYAVRTIAGSTVNWAQGTPVVQGLTLVNQLDVSQYPPGTRTFMIKIVNLSGAESVNAANVEVDVGDPVTSNVILPVDYKASSFPGTYTGAAIDGSGYLTATSLGLMWGPNGATPFWNAVGSTLMWTSAYNPLVYICQFPVLSSNLPGNIIISSSTFVGVGWTIEYCFSDSNPPMWTSGSSPMWTSGSAPFWTVNFSAYQPWTGSLPAQAGIYQFRITIPGGQQKGSIQALTISLDVPDVDESFGNLSIAATTGTRVPITKTYRVIEVVNITKEGTGTGVRAEWIDKVTTIGAGPLIKVFDSSGNAVAGTVDVIIQGY